MTRFKRHPRPRLLVLVGFMGAGKTSVGRALARTLGWRFVDLDEVVEIREQRTVADIFRESGEASFRQVESAALGAILAEAQTQPMVLAVGGGAFVPSGNAELLRRTGATIVFLDAALEELRRRCSPKAGQRPLFQDEDQFRRLYAARRLAYMEADIRVETTGLSVDDAASEVLRRLDIDRLGANQHANR